MSLDADLRQTCLEEAQELLTELESALLELEAAPTDTETVNKVFRALHTIKGSGSMFGFEDVAAFTHSVETSFDLARSGRMPVTRPLLDLTLEAKDLIHTMFADPRQAEAEAGRREAVTLALKTLSGQGQNGSGQAPEATPAAPSAAEGPPPPPAVPVSAHPEVFRVRFKPSANVTEPEVMVAEVCALGRCEVFRHDEAGPDGSASPRWDLVVITQAGADAVKDVFAFVEEDGEARVEKVEDGAEPEVTYKRLGEILVERGDLSAEDLNRVLGERPRLGEVLASSGLVTPQAVAAALAEQQAAKTVKAEKGRTEPMGSIRVSEDKLDKLVDLVGELVILQARLSQNARSRGKKDRAFHAFAEELERLSDDMRYYILKMRMLPFGTMLNKFRRLTRDLSAELGKEVDLEVRGEETELDKTLIDKLFDPMLHILRNSLDHGVEKPEARVAAGKPARGTVTISAEHAGGDVLIRVADDGAGLDEGRILAKAVERGLVEPGAQLSREQIRELIFQPGFSTAEKITGVSGRGVGMDVVKRAIESLSGMVWMESERGRGTTLTIKLPLTLAIIDGLHVTVGREAFIIPLQMVSECVDLTQAQQSGSGARKLFNHRGEAMPYVSLRDYFGVGGEIPRMVKIVVASVEGRKVGVVVDAVVGQCQTVIKSLGGVYKNVRSVSGASISGDGSVILILDIPAIVQRAVKAHEGGTHVEA
jgi:two-component system chemotaxis sensor kinase CheA